MTGFLKRNLRGRRCVASPSGDEGMVLIVAVSVAAVVLSLGLVVTATAVNSTNNSAEDRQRTGAIAAAESGLNYAFDVVRTSAKTDDESNMPCTLPDLTVGAFPDSYSVALSVTYTKSSGVETTPGNCLTNADTPVSAVLRATATPDRVLGTPQDDGSRTMQENLTFATTSSSGSSPFDQAVFSNGNLAFTNALKTTNGGVFTNGNYTCNSSGDVDGKVIAVGNVSLTNNCVVEAVEAGGKYDCTSQGRVEGNVTAAGTGRTEMTNTCQIDGSLWTRGDIRFTATPKVLGNLISAATGTSLNRPVAATIGGSVRLKGTQSINGNGTQQQGIGGTLTTSDPTTPAPAAPQPVVMPVVQKDTTTPGFTRLTSTQWVNQNAIANNAPTWSAQRNTTNGGCGQLAGANYSLNGGLRSPAAPTIIDFTGCSSPPAFNDVDITVYGDLIFYVNSMSSSNGLGLISGDGEVHQVQFIVPAVSTPNPCTAGGGSITFNSGGTVISDKINLLLYAPGTVSLTNTVSFYGSVYACATNWSVAVTVNYTSITPPGSAATVSPTYDVVATDLFEVSTE